MPRKAARGPTRHVGFNMPKEMWERLQSYIEQKTPRYGQISATGVMLDMIERCLSEEGFYPDGRLQEINLEPR